MLLARFSIQDSTINNNNSYGILVYSGFPTTIQRNAISQNAGDGFDYSSSDPLVFTDNSITNNSSYAAEMAVTGQLLTISGNSGSGNLYNAIYLSGTFNDLELAPQGDLVYRFDNVTIPSGNTLTLDPGTIVKTVTTLTVAGTLDAAGTATSPVVITSWKDDSVGGDSNADGNTTAPAKGDWVAIYVANGSVNLNYTTVEYGGGGCYYCYGMIANYYYGGAVSNANITINNSTITDSASSGVFLISGTNVTGALSIQDSTINNNNSYGILVYSGFPTTIQRNAISQNAGDGFDYSSSDPLVFTDNSITNNSSYAAEMAVTGQLLTISGNSGSGNLYNAIYLSGTFNDLELAPQGDLVYRFDNVTIPSGNTLTLDPGTIVKTVTTLTVAGTLDAAGTATSPVVITSWKDDSVGGDSNADGNTTAPAKGDWVAIYVANGSVNLNYTTVEYGGGGCYYCYGMIANYYYGGAVSNANITINNSTITDSASSGVFLISGTNVTGALFDLGLHNK